MQYTCLDIQEKVLEKLQADETLSAYVKKFDIGEENVSRKFFPYISVVSVTEEIEPLCIGPGAPDLHRYRIVIQGGTNSLLPEVARVGNDSGKKGIVQLTDDIVAALFPGSLGGVIKQSLRLESASQKATPQSAGRTRIATVVFSGTVKF